MYRPKKNHERKIIEIFSMKLKFYLMYLGEDDMLPNDELILITLGSEFAFKSNGINA